MSHGDPATIDVMDRAQPDGHDNVVTFFRVPWDVYVSMDHLRSPRIRRAYLDGVLELVSPGEYHEVVKKLLARFLEAYAIHRGTVLNAHGSETLRKERSKAGVEPDECYFLGTTPKEFPDLAIEVVSTHESIDKLEIYRRLRVREVWLWQDEELALYRLFEKGYKRIRRSRVLPEVDITDLVRRVRRANPWQQTREIRAYIRWLDKH